MKIDLPELCLVVLVGASGSGKSTFAAKHFAATEILSSDAFRAAVCDDETDQSATEDAFAVLHFVARKRLARGRLTVIDATNVQAEARRSLLALAREAHIFAIAIVLDVPEVICQERNALRQNRAFSPHVVRRHISQLRRSLKSLRREGFRQVFVLSPDEFGDVQIARKPLWVNRRELTGPFDIIGDVHGCLPELRLLLEQLGYRIQADDNVIPPVGRRAIFLGDLVDRGPDTPGVLRLVMSMVSSGTALCVPGNHDVKLVRALRGHNVRLVHGLDLSMNQLALEGEAFSAKVADFLDGLVSHYVLDGGRLVVAHAGLKAEFQGRTSGAVREFALYGETTGQQDEFGLPVRLDWSRDYRGPALVAYGHTPVLEARFINNTINLDTGCVFGGRLSALRYPEREIISVPALREYAASARPLTAPISTEDDLLDLDDVIGKRAVETRLRGRVTVRQEQARAAMEVMSRFAVSPRWLIYLPPTMSPPETSKMPEMLERPEEAFAYYRSRAVREVILQEKHMGSRALIILCRDEMAVRRRFGADGLGIILTRTGRRFFADAAFEHALLERLGKATGRAGLWDSLETDWLLIDAELMPWSAKAQALIAEQYAPVGRAGLHLLRNTENLLEAALQRGVDVRELFEYTQVRRHHLERYIEAYRRYCWPVTGIDDLRLAPFHLLASEGKVHVNKPHTWHLECFAGLDDPLVVATNHRVIDLEDGVQTDAGIRWWEELVERGGEGMVVKPLEFVVYGEHGLVQPAIKVRGPEYLRIIYGPEYLLPTHLERLRMRNVSTKRSLALREFALGIEALERFTRGDGLRRVHEAVFAILALESEPIDPRL